MGSTLYEDKNTVSYAWIGFRNNMEGDVVKLHQGPGAHKSYLQVRVTFHLIYSGDFNLK
jgi:hypothetical protein